jgi:hypothetical protein
MTTTLGDLAPGDTVQIKYRVWEPAHGLEACKTGEAISDRWVRARVVACETATWPLARLADGQATEIRPFMTWRLVARAERRTLGEAA